MRKYIISILFGLFIGYYIYVIIYRYIVSDIYHGPDSNIIKKYVYKKKNSDEYYVFNTVPCFNPL